MKTQPQFFRAAVLLLIVFTLPACASFMGPPVIKATDQGLTAEVKQLIADGEDVNATTGSGVSALLVAAARGHRDIAEYLIAQGADVDAAVTEAFEKEGRTVYPGVTPLFAALGNKHPEIGRMLIQNGADVNKNDINGTTPLIVAAAQNDPKIVAALIQKGAEVNAATTNTYVYEGRTIDAGATPLIAALANNRLESAKLLMDKDADVTHRNECNVGGLMIAAADGQTDIVRLLLENGADPNASVTKDFIVDGKSVFEGATSLMAAAYAGHEEVVKLLIEAGADVNAETKYGGTALMAASAEGHLGAAEFLAENGAEVNARTTETFAMDGAKVPKGSSAISGASYNGHAAVVQCLIDHGADVNIKDEVWLMDPLYLASYMEHLDVVKVLIANGADVFAECKRGTAHGNAYVQGNKRILQCINDARKEAKEKANNE